MDEHPPNPPPAGALRRGLYLDAQTTGPGSAHDRLDALALLPFVFDAEARIIEIHTGEALSCPNPHRPRFVAHGAAAGDARAPGIDLAAASALIERAHLLVTHTPGFSRALLETLVPAVHETRWLEWELGVPAPDESIHLHSPASHGLDECSLGLWLLAQPLAGSSRSMLALMLDQPPDMPGTPPVSDRLQ